ncbi:glutamine amidotransferase class I [Aminobacter sp. AP02]|nr:glutamine amidotransferase class I [Aminobacter sp. AP02]
MFGEFWRAAGHSEHIVELDEGEAIPALDGFDILAVMGGPMDVWQEDAHPWLKPEKAAIRRWVRELDRPYLGICLGHQLLTDALGGEVSLMRQPEVGLATVELTKAGALIGCLTASIRQCRRCSGMARRSRCCQMAVKFSPPTWPAPIRRCASAAAHMGSSVTGDHRADGRRLGQDSRICREPEAIIGRGGGTASGAGSRRS